MGVAGRRELDFDGRAVGGGGDAEAKAGGDRAEQRMGESGA
jgi:hypothetical protein